MSPMDATEALHSPLYLHQLRRAEIMPLGEFMVSAALAQVVTTRFQSSPLLCFLLVRNTYAGVCT